MKVILAKSAGFCWGVKRAVDKARSLARENRGPVYTDGPLIHNQQMMEQLRAEGVIEVSDPQFIASNRTKSAKSEGVSDSALRTRTKILLIRAHGIPPDRRAMLEKLPVTLVDVTCPDVARIQGLIKKYSQKGYHIIIFGDVGHAEVTGLLGHAGGSGHVVSRIQDIDSLPEIGPVCLVSQSTQFPSSYAKIIKAVRQYFPDVEVLDTICESTKNRQKELIEIAETVDAIVVVGGAHSANTIRLVELAKTLKPVSHIQTSDQLKPEQFCNFRTVGLTAGSSTPSFIIEDVKKTLEKM